MAVEVIEGTAEPVQPVGVRGKYGRFQRLRITTASGESRVFPKIAVGEPVRSEAAKGGPGRYYVMKSDGAFGLIGVRRPDGGEYYGHYMNIEPLMLVVGLLGAACAVGRFVFGITDLPLLASILGPLLLIGWYYLRSQRLAGRRSFEADRGG